MARFREHKIAVRWLARLGYGCRGLVYLLVGVLALLDAVGAARQQSVSTKGALKTLLGQPFDHLLLGVIAIGLTGFALWRLIQAFADPDDHGNDFRAWLARAGYVGSAITHGGLAFVAGRLALTLGTEGGGGAEDWTATLMQQSFGRWLVAAAGVTIVGAGLAHLYAAATARFEQYLSMEEETLRWARPICQFGLVARGVVVTIVGLVAFGIFCFIEATHRRIEPPAMDV